MPKINTNNRITESNIYGRIIQHDLWLDQSVQMGSSPTFANLHISGDTVINGNLAVYGNTTVLDTLFTQFEDNILLLNALETSSGVTLNEAGLEVNRGTFPNFRMVYTENTGGATSVSGGTFRLGLVNDTQAVATRQDNPLNDGIMTWNNIENRIDSGTDIKLDILFSSTTPNVGLTSGSVIFSGGIIAKKDLLVYDTLSISTQGNNIFSQTNGSLKLNSVNDILLNPIGNVKISSLVGLHLGSTTLVSDSIGNFQINTGTIGNINITTANIKIPQNSILSLGDSTLKTDGTSDLRLTSKNAIYITPTTGQSIIIPQTSPIILGNSTEQISSTVIGDVSILASNNITLTPSVSVRIPTDIPLKFGGSGNQRILSNASSELEIKSVSNIVLQCLNINISTGTLINMGDASFQGTLTDSSNNTGFIQMNKLKVLDTSANSIVSLGTIKSVHVVTTDVNVNTITFGSGHIIAETTNSLQLSIPSGKQVIIGSDEIIIDKDSSLTSISSLVTSSIVATSLTISGITLFSNTLDITSPTTASIVASGGVIVQKKLRVNSSAFIGGGLDMNNTVISNVATPVNPQDAVNLSYVSSLNQGLSWKEAVEAGTVTAGTLATDFIAGSIIDGYTLLLDDRILIKNQINGIENGIYIVKASGSPLRTVDFALGYEASGYATFVNQGTLNKELGFLCTSDKPTDIVGTHSLTFVQFTALGQITAGDGLLKNLNDIYVNVDNVSIDIFSDQLRIKNTALGTGLTGGSGIPITTTPNQSHVTQLGTITTGVWNASVGQVPYGFTGRSSFTLGNLLIGNGTNALIASEKLYFNTTTGTLGIGTSAPTKTLHVTSKVDAHLLLVADSDAINDTRYPLVRLEASNVANANLAIARSNGSFLNGVFNNATVLFGSGDIQLGSNNKLLSTWTTFGNIGFGTNTPIDFFTVNGITSIIDTTVATGQTNGAFIVYGDSSFIGKVSFNDNINVYNNKTVTISGAVTAATLNLSSTNGNTLVLSGKAYSLDSTESTGITIGSIVTLGGIGVSKDITLGGSLITEQILFNTSASLTLSVGSILLVADTVGSLTMQTNGNLNIHRNTTFDSLVTLSDDLDVLGIATINELTPTTFRPDTNGLFTSIANTAGSSLWVYLGQITNVLGNVSDLEFKVNGSNYEFGTTYTSTLQRNSNVYVYNDTTNNHLFLHIIPNATEYLYVYSCNTILIPKFEGTGGAPNGTFSGYTGSWTNILNTLSADENIVKRIGGITINDTFVSNDYIPKITSIGTNTGITYTLSQNETLSFPSVFTDTIPDQTTASSTQIKFTNAANSNNDFYIGYSVYVNGEYRNIIAYNGAQRVATINTAWTVQPVENDIANLYDHKSVSLYYNNTVGAITISYATINQGLVPNTKCNLVIADASAGNILSNTLQLTNTTGYSLLTQGDVSCLGNINGLKLRLGTFATSANILNIREVAPVISIQSTNNSFSGIDFSFDTSNIHYGLIARNSFMGLTFTTTSESISSSNLALTVNTSGNIGIKTTDASTALTLQSGSVISTDSTSGFLMMFGGKGSSSANITLTGVGNTESNYTTIETTQFHVNTLQGDQLTTLNTAGFLIFTNTTTNAGIMINDTRQATNFTTGNAFTSRGGGAVTKDFYVGGSLYVNGAMVITGVNTSPTIVYSNPVNCTVSNDDNTQLVLVGTEYMLSFYTEVVPTAGNFSCSFDFTVPNRTTNFTAKGDIICMVSGYTNTDVFLYNTFGRGVTASTTARILFQSVDTSTHTLQVLIRYTNV